MNTENAIRFLHCESLKCRDRDAGEALCLLLPALLRIFKLEPMEDVEAAAFRFQFKQELQKFEDDTDRADGRQAVLARPMQSSLPDATESTNNPPGAHRARPAPAGACFEHSPATL